MKKFYITYGFTSGHAYSYSVIEAEDWDKAYWLAAKLTNWTFARVYRTKEETGVKEFGLHLYEIEPIEVEEEKPKRRKRFRKFDLGAFAPESPQLKLF